MPEGDTIFRAARTLHRALHGAIVTRFETVFPQLMRIDEDGPVVGRTVEQVTSRGKHLLVYFSGDLILRTHMRMHGSWHIYRPGERWRVSPHDMRILVGTAAFEAVAFNVPVAEFRTPASLERDPAIRTLGPDLLDPGCDLADAVRRLRTLGDTPIGEALLNQRAVAGIGNVFKSEALFEAGVSPFTRTGAMDDDGLRALLLIARRQLQVNTTDPLQPGFVAWRGGRRTTGRAHPDAGVWVYGRAGAPCRRCGARIEISRDSHDARLTYFCPVCQR
jgi:endonuclease-8